MRRERRRAGDDDDTMKRTTTLQLCLVLITLLGIFMPGRGAALCV
jgi:hypothetical protein